MKDRTPRCEKVRLVAYLPVEMVKAVQLRALRTDKTISLYIAELVEADMAKGVGNEEVRR